MASPQTPRQRPNLARGRSIHLDRYATPEKEALSGLKHPVALQPRKYVRGRLETAYENPFEGNSAEYQKPLAVYRKSCEARNAAPNSYIENAPVDLIGHTISFRDTYLGEKGFVAALPLLNHNKHWTALDASQNGLRNEAVICLVDMLLRPQHANRVLYLDLSSNPISRSGALALQELVSKHNGLQWLSLRFTKVPRDLALKIQESLEQQKEVRRLQPLRARSRSFSPSSSRHGSPWSRPSSALLAQISEEPLYSERRSLERSARPLGELIRHPATSEGHRDT